MSRFAIIAWFLFKGWMFYDAVKRGAPSRWYWIIPFVPGGALIYLVAVKLRSPEADMLKTRVTEALRPSPTVAEIQREFDTTPSVLNRIRLGQALFDDGQYAAARDRFTEVLAERPKEKDALFGLALCRLELGDPEAAVAPLEQVINRARRYRDYAAWEALAEALWRSGQQEECLALCDKLVATSPRGEHQLMRAHYLQQAGHHADAQLALARAKEADAQIPDHLRRGHRPWVVNARSLMRGRGSG